MKIYKPLLACLFLALSTASTYSYSASIACDVEDASANGSFADACVGDNAIGANPTDEKTFVNTNFQGSGDPFLYVGKFEGGTGSNSTGADLAGFTLQVFQNSEDDDFLFGYRLLVPDEWVGVVVDWSLVTKQGNNSTIAYLFEEVTLGIDGGFNHFWINPANKTVNDFSHATGFIRGEPLTPPGGGPIPEPSLVLLMGIGFLGFGASQLRKTRKI